MTAINVIFDVYIVSVIIALGCEVVSIFDFCLYMMIFMLVADNK